MSNNRNPWATTAAETQEMRVRLLDSEREAIQEQYLALRPLRYAAAACGLAALAVASTALVGRFTGNWILASYSEGHKIIVPAVGLALVLLATGVVAMALARRTRHLLARTLGIIVMVIAGLRLLEHAIGVNWGSSELFLPPPWLPHAPEEAPAALPTAAAVLFASFFLAHPSWRGAIAARIVAVGAVTSIGAAFLLGYVYGRPLLYGEGLIPIALPAALGLTLVGIGMAFLIAAQEAAVRRLIFLRRADDQAERERLAADVAEQRNQLEAIVNHTPAALLFLDGRDLTVKWSNIQYTRLLNESFLDKDLAGLKFSDLVRTADEEGVTEAVRKATAGQLMSLPEFEYRSFERGTTYFQWVAVPVKRTGDGAYDVLIMATDITEPVTTRRRIEELAEEARRRADELGAMFATMPDGVIIYDREGRIIRQNQAAECLMNFLPEFLDMPLAERYREMRPVDESGQPIDAEQTPLGRALAGESLAEGIVRFEWIGDRAPWIRAAAAPLRDSDDQITGAVMVISDITHLRQIEAELRSRAEALRISNEELAATNERLAASEERYRTIGELVPYGIWTTDAQGAISYVSPAILELTGLTFEEYAGFKWADLLPDGEREEFVSAWLAASQAGEYWSHEYRILGQDGQYHWLIGRGVPQFDPDGKLKGYLGVNVDIGDLKAAEEAVRRQRGFLQGILDQMPSGVLVIEAGTTRVLLANGRINEIWGHEMGGQIMRDFLSGVHATRSEGELQGPEDWPVIRALEHAEIITNEVLRVERPDGRVYHVAANAAPIRDEKGNIVAAIVTATDVTEAAEAQEELRRHRDHLEDLVQERTAELAASEYKFRQLIETAQAAIVRWNREGIIELINDYAERLFGYETEGLLGKSITLIAPPIHETGVTAGRSIDAILADPEAFRLWGSEQITKDGRRLWIVWSHYFIYDQAGKVETVLAIGTDRTEQHRVQRELEANQRRLRAAAAELAVTEQRERQRLAAALHDEVAQTLSAIKLNLGMLGATMGSSPAAEQVTGISGMVDEAIRQSRAIMSELSPPILKTQGLIEALRWWAEQLEEKHGLAVSVEVEGAVERFAPDVEATVFQMAKELLQNTVKHAHATQAAVTARCDETRLEVEVEDDGIGFDPATVETTEMGGFGLFSVRERLAYLGGELRIRSAPGQGTRMTISLPVLCRQPAS